MLLEFELKVLSIFFISQFGCEHIVLALLHEISHAILKYSHANSNIDRLASLFIINLYEYHHCQALTTS